MYILTIRYHPHTVSQTQERFIMEIFTMLNNRKWFFPPNYCRKFYHNWHVDAMWVKLGQRGCLISQKISSLFSCSWHPGLFEERGVQQCQMLSILSCICGMLAYGIAFGYQFLQRGVVDRLKPAVFVNVRLEGFFS